jgi:putative intracellular protease/amidase
MMVMRRHIHAGHRGGGTARRRPAAGQASVMGRGRRPCRAHLHDAHHAHRHVQEQVAVKRPVARLCGDIEADLAAGQHIHRMLARRMFAMARHQFEEVAVQMDGMRHHRVVDQRDAHPFAGAQRDRLVRLLMVLPSIDHM